MPGEEYSEADTRAKLITPALHERGWTEDMIRREETAGAILSDEAGAFRSDIKRADYVLRVIAEGGAQPVAVALIEAKRNTDSPGLGLEQAKRCAGRMNVPFVFSSNGRRFVEYDSVSEKTSGARDIGEFPRPEVLRRRYEDARGFGLDEKCAKPLTTPYHNGEGVRRYYQDAAIRAAMEKIAGDEKAGRPPRVLLSLATGAGKTFIAVHLIKRLADAGTMKRALFLCDRDALREQALGAFQEVFGDEAEEARREPGGGNKAANAGIHIATYQTLGIAEDSTGEDKTFAAEHYPENHFSHIVIDECHRSAWNKWSEILRRNPKAAQIGLTATPRKINEKEAGGDRKISADNIRHFGGSAYSYSLTQGAEDGYLALCRISKADINLDKTGVGIDELMARNPADYLTGEPLTREQLKKVYERSHFEGKLVLPDRVSAMCRHLFAALAKNGDPRQKTIIFCVSDLHAELVAKEMGNICAEWRGENGKPPVRDYAFQCTAKTEGNKALPDFRGEDSHHFVAATVDLLSTGVDIRRVRNIAFFRYVNSPISLHQMIGRGARIDETAGKLDFTVHDYTDATRLLGEGEWAPPPGAGGKRKKRKPPAIPVADGFEVHIGDTGNFVVVEGKGGEMLRQTAEEYRSRLGRRLLEKAKTPDELRALWINPQERGALMQFLLDEKCPVSVLSALAGLGQYDHFDILAETGYGAMPQTRAGRAEAFDWKNREWLENLPPQAAKVLCALARLFADGGVEELENPAAFNTPSVQNAGGIQALQTVAGEEPANLLRQIKERIFAA